MASFSSARPDMRDMVTPCYTPPAPYPSRRSSLIAPLLLAREANTPPDGDVPPAPPRRRLLVRLSGARGCTHGGATRATADCFYQSHAKPWRRQRADAHQLAPPRATRGPPVKGGRSELSGRGEDMGRPWSSGRKREGEGTALTAALPPPSCARLPRPPPMPRARACRPPLPMARAPPPPWRRPPHPRPPE